jgi:hypothetical protein
MNFENMNSLLDRSFAPKVEGSANFASEFYTRLVTAINEFDEKLDEAHEVGARLVNFGASVTIHLTGLGYHNPSLIKFFGKTDNGEPVELIQHVSQISILLIKVKRTDLSGPKRKIGVQSDREDS